MCFSPEADAVMGVVIGAIAVDAIRHVHKRSQLALASFPLILAAHQLIEVFVWWGADGTVGASVGRAATYVYLFIAFGVPLLIPHAVAAVEPDPRRRRVMRGLGIVGGLVSVVLLAGVVTGPVAAVDMGNHLAYDINAFHGVALTVVYVVVILGSSLASSHRYIRLFGVFNFAAVAVLGWLTFSGFVSLWCAWAAITSLIIAIHLRNSHPDRLALVADR